MLLIRNVIGPHITKNENIYKSLLVVLTFASEDSYYKLI